jgi:hypothetical protein
MLVALGLYAILFRREMANTMTRIFPRYHAQGSMSPRATELAQIVVGILMILFGTYVFIDLFHGK